MKPLADASSVYLPAIDESAVSAIGSVPNLPSNGAATGTDSEYAPVIRSAGQSNNEKSHYVKNCESQARVELALIKIFISSPPPLRLDSFRFP